MGHFPLGCSDVRMLWGWQLVIGGGGGGGVLLLKAVPHPREKKKKNAEKGVKIMRTCNIVRLPVEAPLDIRIQGNILWEWKYIIMVQ